jgi:hypothetical protein
MNKMDYVNQVVIHLAKKENRETSFPAYQLFNKLQIPEEKHKIIETNLFLVHGFVSGNPTIGEPIIKITDKGLQYAQELNQKHFEEFGEPLFVDNKLNASIDYTCSLLFEEHKKDPNFRLVWTLLTYQGMPSNLNAARDKMLEEEILKDATKANTRVTRLSSEYYGCNNYSEAFKNSKEKLEINRMTQIVTTNNHITSKGVFSTVIGSGNVEVSVNPKEKKESWWLMAWGYIKALFTS